jgi:LytR cell envelope-related transcriptional attenuator
VAWLGAFVLLGLALLGADVLRERSHDRKERRMAELGVDRLPWSRRRQQFTLIGVIAALVIVLGVVLWARGGGDSSATEQLNVLPDTTSSSQSPSTSTSSTTTTTLAPGRPPQQVRVSVVTSSGVSGAAAQKSGALGALGYQMVGLDNGVARSGTVVQCKAGFEKEAAVLAQNVGQATVEPLPNPPPTASANPDCVVVLGA